MRLRVSLRGQALVYVLLCARGSAHASESRTSKENNQHGASLASQTPHPNSRQKKTKHNTRRSCDTMPHARARSALRGLQRPTLASPRLDAGTSAPSHMHPSHARTHRILDAGRHPNIAGRHPNIHVHQHALSAFVSPFRMVLAPPRSLPSSSSSSPAGGDAPPLLEDGGKEEET